jgi:mercuric ion binding protein
MKRITITILALCLGFALLGTAQSALAAEKTVTLTIPTMDCGSSILKVTWLLQDHEGVTEAKADMTEPIVTVTFDEEKVSLDDITGALKAEGFDVEKVTPAE